MPDSEAKKAWIKANTTTIATKFNNRTDADILAYLENVESKQGEIKRLLRLAIAMENK